MTASAFSRYAFSRALKSGDSNRFDIELKTEKHAAITDAILCSRSPDQMANYNEIVTGNKYCVSYSDYSMTLVLRALGNNLRYRAKVQMPDRDEIVRGVKQTIAEATPMAIHRRDLTSFYESIPLAGLKSRLLDSALLSPRARNVLKKYFEIHCKGVEVGVPRGLPISPVLAEIVMQSYDEKIRTHPGVYRYYRFSDDILIFSYDFKLDIDKLLLSILPSEFSLNKNKWRSFVLSGADSHALPYKSFEYLGYDFHVWNGEMVKGKSRPYSVCVAEGKIKKLKSRSILAAKKLKSEGDSSLFVDRILFITGNYYVARSRINNRAPKRMVRSGIYFNYKHCIEDKENKILPRNSTRLKELDGFLYSLLWGKKSEFSNEISKKLSISQKNVLKRAGFFKGFDLALMRRFRPARIGQIKAAWAYVR